MVAEIVGRYVGTRPIIRRTTAYKIEFHSHWRGTMKIKSTIIFAMALLVVIASVALVGGVLQKAQDAGTSTSDPGFVPSTGQINLG